MNETPARTKRLPTVRLTPEERRIIEDEAHWRNRSMSDLIREALRAYLLPQEEKT